MEVRKKINLKHLTVWILVLLILVSALSLRLEITESINRALIFLIAQVIVFYTCSLILIPLLLIPKKRLFFVLGVFFTIVSSICIIHFGGIILDYRNPLLNDLIDIHASRRYILGLALSSFATLFLSSIYTFTIIRNKREQLETKAKIARHEAESKFLRSQINPHFIFNNLNNIYTLAQLKSDKTPDAILRLSDLLKYVLYDSENKIVNLSQELDYLCQFINLSLMKDENRSNVKVDIRPCHSNLQIAPLILIPFVENAFKHSNIEDKKNGFIHIFSSCSNNSIKLKVENSISISKQKNHTRGIGLENVKRRLDLIYKDKYQLNITKSKDKYNVSLEIELE